MPTILKVIQVVILGMLSLLMSCGQLSLLPDTLHGWLIWWIVAAGLTGSVVRRNLDVVLGALAFTTLFGIIKIFFTDPPITTMGTLMAIELCCFTIVTMGAIWKKYDLRWVAAITLCSVALAITGFVGIAFRLFGY